MTMRQALDNWNGNTPEVGAVSHLADGGITGLKLTTDDDSVMMQEYIHLQDISDPGNRRITALFDALSVDMKDESADYNKYMAQAQTAEFMGRQDVALALQIIAREEKNHHEILEALIPGGNVGFEPDLVDEPDLMAITDDIRAEQPHGIIPLEEIRGWLSSHHTQLPDYQVLILRDYVNSRA